MMWAVMGVGMLFNAIQGNAQNARMREMMATQQAETQKMLKSMQTQSKAMNEVSFDKMFELQTGMPEFPEKSFANLQNMQAEHMEARQAFSDQLNQDLQSAKTAFFEGNHYETKLGAEGRPEVATNDKGEPQVGQGKENSDQRVARATFENQKKSELNEKHSLQKEQFVNKERENFKEFLAMNREQLNNPYVQGELQRMVVNTKKKSLDLQQGHEEDRWRVDMPPSEEIAVKLDTGLKQLREMDQKHIEAEENSEDTKTLVDHDQKVAAILYEERQSARQERQQEDNFTMDPRKMMAAAQRRNEPRDVGEVLPSYLTNAMYDMGIYQV